jgi:hypothetical protein
LSAARLRSLGGPRWITRVRTMAHATSRKLEVREEKSRFRHRRSRLSHVTSLVLKSHSRD